MYKRINTWIEGYWTLTDFPTREHFRDFLIPLFKEPGQYEFDETSFEFNAQTKLYLTNNKNYCVAPLGTKDYINYWNDQKAKCRDGVIFKNKDITWYLPREYYMWINFLPIFDKVAQKYDFPQVWDSQYHMALYEILAELHYKHTGLLKKRQFGSSYYHCAKLINQLYFEEGVTMKIGASHKDYINEKGSWKFLNEYKSFLNEHTAWYRPMTPDKVLMWQQQIEVTRNNRKSMKGLKGVIQGLTFDKDPTTGVGGGIKYFFYEEAGIAPTMHITTEYLFPAMKSGHLYTGMFIAAGSVGDLDQCDPLKQLIIYPEINDIYPVTSDLLDDKRTPGKTGLFIPEQWSMPPYIDQFGNSKVQQALDAINEQRKVWKKDLPPDKYQLRISQAPTNIAEAFAWRKASVFPLHLINAQIRRIEEKEYPYENVELHRNATGGIIAETSSKIAISEWPITTNLENKEGVITVWERPVANPEFGMYYFSIDPVSEGKTTTSDSLCSIIIYKNPVEVTQIKSDEITNFIERDGIVASWCGRFDDINKTHERLELLIEWYNAWGAIENNISLFIQHMKNKKKQRYLATKKDMLFLKEAEANASVHQEYGWRNTGTLFSAHMLSYAIEYVSEEIDHITKEDGSIVKTVYGVERIPDIMLLKEMAGYQHGVNVDRLVTFSALIAFAKLQQANGRIRKRVEDSNKDLKKSSELFKLLKSPFRFIGNQQSTNSGRPVRNPFKNFR